MRQSIAKIHAQEILDSRGNPTISVSAHLENGVRGTASVPSGVSTGSHEAVELRDGDKKRYGGKGVTKTVRIVNEIISPELHGADPSSQQSIDLRLQDLDGTENKSRLGANAILGVSLAVAHAAAKASKLPLYRYVAATYSLPSTHYHLPRPMMNIVNGGRHADWALDVQECMIIPFAKNFAERVRIGAEVFHALHDILKKKGLSAMVGDEGGYAPRLGSNEEALQLIMLAIKAAGYTAGKDVFLGLDVAASEFYNEKKDIYELKRDGKTMDAIGLGTWYYELLNKYPILSIEDPYAEDDWESWTAFMRALKHKNLKTHIIGDDLYTTNTERLEQGIDQGASNAILIKPNQIGTLTETIECIQLAQKHHMAVIISHRSGETLDTTIADLAVAVSADFMKAGAPNRGERVAKYNRLMEIEQELHNNA